MPVLGATWEADLDCSAFDGTAIVSIRRQPSAGRLTANGEVLIAGTVVHQMAHGHARTVSRLGWEVPSDLSLVGARVYAQGRCMGLPTSTGQKGTKAAGGLSNAIDLILGF
jgi:hypothetical protein